MEPFDAQGWALKEFGTSELGHGARRKRAVRIAASLVQHPRASLPRAMGDAGQAKGAYRFLSNTRMSGGDLWSGPVMRTVERCREQATVYVIQDTTVLNFTPHRATEGMGPIHDRLPARGMLVHTALAVSAESEEVLGVLHQQVWARPETRHPRGETSRQRLRRRRESERWSVAEHWVAEHLSGSEDGSGGPRVVAVWDREGDVFEAIEELDALGHSFIIRANQDRRLDSTGAAYLFATARQAPVRAVQKVQVPAAPGRKARTATLEVRAGRVELRPPKARDRTGSSQPVHVVWVEEVEPAPGVEPLQWCLLTREPIETADQVLAVVRGYQMRWLIEELHMGIKTGCRMEDRQLQTRAALEKFLVFATVIASHLLRMRDLARSPQPHSAQDVLTAAQHTVLCALKPRMMAGGTARDALRAIASLGGFLARKGDGEPGWRTLWAGYEHLLIAEQGFLLAKLKTGQR